MFVLHVLESGLKTGLFVSPHISSFRERMVVDTVPIPSSSVVTLLPRILDLCKEHSIPATFFEITTMLAFMHFRSSRCDVVVLETGLGGRLDSTNIVQPDLCVITNIGLEHTRILGGTVEEIAGEKAGIIKGGVPVVVGTDCPRRVMEEKAGEVGAPYFPLPPSDDDDNDNDKGEESDFDLDFDLQNSHLSRYSLSVLRSTSPSFFSCITPSSLSLGLSRRPPCRFQEFSRLGVDCVLDVAHNPPALRQLFGKFGRRYEGRKGRVIVGMSR